MGLPAEATAPQLAEQHDQRPRRSPSLRRELPEFLAWAYPKGCRAAADETGRPRASFPPSCPWSIEQILDDDFLPEPAEE